MSGRNRNFRGGPYDDPRPFIHRGPAPPPHSIPIEEELELQQRDIQRLLTENRRVIDDNVMLQRDLSATKDEIYRINQMIPKLRGEKEMRLRELVDRERKLESEIRSVENIRSEVVKLRGEAKKLSELRKDLSSQFQNLTKDVSQLQAENKQVNVMKSDVEKMRNEMADARRIYDYEKKGNEELVEQNRSMENNLISMAREIEKLRAEQANTERRAIGIGGYGMMTGSPETRYTGPYSGPYGATYDKRARR